MKSVVNTDRARAARTPFESIKSEVDACALWRMFQISDSASESRLASKHRSHSRCEHFREVSSPGNCTFVTRDHRNVIRPRFLRMLYAISDCYHCHESYLVVHYKSMSIAVNSRDVACSRRHSQTTRHFSDALLITPRFTVVQFCLRAASQDPLVCLCCVII